MVLTVNVWWLGYIIGALLGAALFHHDAASFALIQVIIGGYWLANYALYTLWRLSGQRR